MLGVGAVGTALDAHPVSPGVLAITCEGEHLVDLELAAMVRDDLRPSPQ